MKLLFEKLREKNLQTEGVNQKLGPPESASILNKGITTLSLYHRELSPMLKARFEYCSYWIDANLGHNWLSLSQIEEYLNMDTIVSQINIRKNFWENALINNYPDSNISLFGIDQVEMEETYLIWSEEEIEPVLCKYVGHNELIFDNLKELVTHYLDE